MGTPYCTVADVLAIVSADALARLATDPQVAVPFSAKGDGTTVTFETPFAYSTAITTFVAGVATANTLIPGAAPDGNDQVTFSPAPALGALITGFANIGAVNTQVVQQAIANASDDITGYLARYGPLPQAALDVVRPRAVFLVRWKIRQRRSMEEWDPIRDDFKRLQSWLEKVAMGKIALPATTPIATAPAPSQPRAVHAERSIFESPNRPWNGYGDPFR